MACDCCTHSWLRCFYRLCRCQKCKGSLRHVVLCCFRHLDSVCNSVFNFLIFTNISKQSTPNPSLDLRHDQPTQREASHLSRRYQCRRKPVQCIRRATMALENRSSIHTRMGRHCSFLGCRCRPGGFDPNHTQDIPSQSHKG